MGFVLVGYFWFWLVGLGVCLFACFGDLIFFGWGFFGLFFGGHGDCGSWFEVDFCGGDFVFF